MEEEKNMIYKPKKSLVKNFLTVKIEFQKMYFLNSKNTLNTQSTQNYF